MNAAVATHDWLEDPTTALAPFVVPVYALVTIGLWFAARPYGDARWKLASASALVSAAVALLANQAISHIWDRQRPFTEHPVLTHLLAAPTPDPSFPSDHSAAAFAIAFAVLVFSRRAGALFLAAAALIAVSRVALGVHYPTDVAAGVVVGWVSARLVTRAGRPWIVRLVGLAGTLTDPLLRPVWDRLARRTIVRS